MSLSDQEIDLVESLCGFKRTITTLDKRSLVIVSPPGDVITHGRLIHCVVLIHEYCVYINCSKTSFHWIYFTHKLRIHRNNCLYKNCHKISKLSEIFLIIFQLLISTTLIVTHCILSLIVHTRHSHINSCIHYRPLWTHSAIVIHTWISSIHSQSLLVLLQVIKKLYWMRECHSIKILITGED